jgi:hypothetical protein
MCCSFCLEEEAYLEGLFGLLKKIGWSAIFTDGAVTSSTIAHSISGTKKVVDVRTWGWGAFPPCE